MASLLPHLLTVAHLFSFIAIAIFVTGSTPVGEVVLDPFETYGLLTTIFLYFVRALTYLSIPFTIANVLGVVWLNTHPAEPKLQASRLLVPFLCFRVVTRGTYPDLVKRNLARNLQVCADVGLDQYTFEVVTDNPLHLDRNPRVQELVVPANYRPWNGALYKARALHFCLEDEVNMLSENDWIVHLDEETLLTESAVIAVANFATLGKAEFGQGVITYANEDIINWFTTLADSIRVAFDYGMMRFTLAVLHRPLFGLKGSFIVSNAAAEKAIGFDFGPTGSIAEDCYFAMTAWKRGYKFDFIQADMWEKSPFSMMDYIKQRKRWFHGHLCVLLSPDIPLYCKSGLIFTVTSWMMMPLNIFNLPLSILYPIPVPHVLNVLASCMGGVFVFLFVFGTLKSFHPRRTGFCRRIVLCIASICVIPLVVLMETWAVLWGIATHRNAVGFHIVKKDTAQYTRTMVAAV